MILKIFAVRDRATVQFGNPMFMVNSGQAIRSFGDEINKPKVADGSNVLASHPDDFDLYALGSFDADSGEFSTHNPQQIARGSDLLLTRS